MRDTLRKERERAESKMKHIQALIDRGSPSSLTLWRLNHIARKIQKIDRTIKEETFFSEHCPVLSDEPLPGETIARCDYKELMYLGGTRFAVYQKGRSVVTYFGEHYGSRMFYNECFAEARDFYNSLYGPEIQSK